MSPNHNSKEDGARYRNPPGLLGRRCLLGGDIPAVINGVLERVNGGLEFEVTWWESRARHCEWVSPSEVVIEINGRY